ncbi:MAG: hypothetical protein WD425_21380 [Nitrospirales bacterium]
MSPSVVTMEECVTYANELGARIGQELGIPVYLYAQAGTVPLWARLELVRRGGLPALGTRMQVDHGWEPAYEHGGAVSQSGIGPSVLHLTDYRGASLRRAFYRVNREGQQCDVGILESEIVGLVPRAAWDEKLSHDLKSRPIKSDPIVEHRLEQSHVF